MRKPRTPRAWASGLTLLPLPAALAAFAQADLLGEVAALLGIVRRHHRIVGRQVPALAIFVGAHLVARPQITLQHLQLFAVLQADHVLVLHRLPYRDGGCAGQGAVLAAADAAQGGVDIL